MKTIKKITSKDLGFSKSTIQEIVFKEKDPKKTIPLYAIDATILKATVEENEKNDYGEYVKFGGSFNQIDLYTGDLLCSSGVMILPEVASDLLASQLARLQDQNPKGHIESIFTIGVKYDENAATSYKFTVDFHNDFIPHNKEKYIGVLPTMKALPKSKKNN
jgi:hypothetical protein